MIKNVERLLGKAEARISSPFGYRINPITGMSEGHNGVDYATYGKKVPCYAPANGTVLRVSKDKFGALFVYIRFPELKKVGLYYHLDKIDVAVNQKIKAGEKVGIVGTTGQSTGVHLHFSWIDDNTKSMNYYNANYSDFEKYNFAIDDVKPVTNIEEALKIFKEKGVANDVAYWMSATHIVSYLDVLILNSATRLKYSTIINPSKNENLTITQAVKKLAENGILNDVNYWVDAVDYIYNIKTLLINIANKL